MLVLDQYHTAAIAFARQRGKERAAWESMLADLFPTMNELRSRAIDDAERASYAEHYAAYLGRREARLLANQSAAKQLAWIHSNWRTGNPKRDPKRRARIANEYADLQRQRVKENSIAGKVARKENCTATYVRQVAREFALRDDINAPSKKGKTNAL